ncbi:MAG: hypothetical protein WDN47_01845 [Candidatus Doudnabacteria bacterium]
MAKKTRKTLDQHLHRYFLFEDNIEFIIFLVWALFIVAFLLQLLK